MDDDPIVKKLPVVFKRIEDCNTYVLQYPLRPIYRPYGDHGRLDNVFIGKQTENIKVDYAVNYSSEFYNEFKREELLKIKQKLSNNEKLDSYDELKYKSLYYHTLSTETSGDVNEYAVGIIENDVFYIIPVTKINQLRHDRSIYDKLTIREEQMKKKILDENNDNNKKSIALNTIEVLDNVSTIGQGINSRLAISNYQLRENILNEDYAKISYIYDIDSTETIELLNNIKQFYCVEECIEDLANTIIEQEQIKYSSNIENNTQIQYDNKKKYFRTLASDLGKIPKVYFNSNKAAYLECLCKGCALSSFIGTTTNKASNTNELGSLSYIVLSKMNIEQQVLYILKVKTIVTFETIKSKIVDTDISDSKLIKILMKYANNLNGVWICLNKYIFSETSNYYEIELLVWDVILCLISKNRLINKIKLVEMTELPIANINNIFNKLLVYVNGQYKLSIESDDQFEQKYPTIAEEQKKKWSVAYAQSLIQQITSINRQRKVDEKKFSEGKGQLFDILNKRKVNELIKELFMKNGAIHKNAFDQLFKQQLRTILEDISIKKDSNAEKDDNMKKRNHILDYIDALSATEIFSLINDSVIILQNYYIIKTIDNTAIDKYRSILLNMYKNNNEVGVTKNELKIACEQVHGLSFTLTDMHLRNIFREVAYSIEGKWYFKGSQVAINKLNNNSTNII